MSRGIPFLTHSALEIVAAPAIIVTPLLLGFSGAATFVAIVVGGLLLALATQIINERRTVPLSAHADLDYALAIFAIFAGFTIGIVTGSWIETVFLVGIGAAQVTLTASTRFSLSPSAA
jgi:hypothetical protein